MGEIIADDSRVRVERVTLMGTDGSETGRIVLRHPGSVVILPVLDDGRVVLIRNSRQAIGESLLELPAGTVEGGDAPEAQAHRELQEETGYRATKLEKLIEFLPCPGISDERMHAYLAQQLETGPQQLDPTEEIEVVPMAVEKLKEEMARGGIQDAKTLAVVLWWLAFGETAGT